jgi:hypothetical protein
MNIIGKRARWTNYTKNTTQDSAREYLEQGVLLKC